MITYGYKGDLIGLTDEKEMDVDYFLFNLVEDLLIIMEENKGMNREGLAKAAGMHLCTLDNLINNEDEMTLGELIDIVKALGCKLKVVLEDGE